MRREYSVALLLLVTAASCESSDCASRICSDYVVSEATVRDWHEHKVRNGPTFAGTDSWRDYMQLIETEARALGMVDLRRNPFTYERWTTSRWPDTSGWSLTVGGEAIEVSAPGANSGNTGPNGIRAELALYQPGVERSYAGGILVVPVSATEFESRMPDWLQAPAGNTLEPGQRFRPAETISRDTVSQLFAANFDGSLPFPPPHHLKTIRDSRAAGAVVIFDMAPERARGLYSFPVPAIYDVPTIYLDREAGRKLVSRMDEGADAVLRLEAETTMTEAWQLAAYLPGRHYGTDADEIVMMITHTDGPSISQENGPLGLLSIVHYFSHMEQADRDKTLMLFLDSRHYIPGREASLPAYDIDNVFGPGGALAPEHGRIVASVHLEHLGQREFREVDGVYEPTGDAEMGGFYVTAFDPIVEIARAALLEHAPENQFLFATGIPGIHCKSQGHWYGLGHHPKRIGVDAIAANMAMMGGYWTSATTMEDLDVGLFIRQVKVMTQITGHFMANDIDELVARPAVADRP